MVIRGATLSTSDHHVVFCLNYGLSQNVENVSLVLGSNCVSRSQEGQKWRTAEKTVPTSPDNIKLLSFKLF